MSEEHLESDSETRKTFFEREDSSRNENPELDKVV